MIKNKLALAFILITFPLMLLSTPVSACSHHHKYKSCYHYCYSCQYTKNKALANRVVTRLRANISTADQHICVVARGHKVILTGRIGTVSQRQLVLDITRNTCGVGLVIDNMHLSEP